MLTIGGYDEVYSFLMEKFDRTFYDEINFHLGYIEGSATLVWEDDKTIVAAGYLENEPGDRITIVFKTLETSLGAEGGLMLLPELLRKAKAIGTLKGYEKKTAVMWCNENSANYKELLESFGFQENATMLKMERRFKKDEVVPGVHLEKGFSFGKVNMDTDEAMKEYLQETANAFGEPDLMEEVRYELDHLGGTIYAIFDHDTPVSYVTTWEDKTIRKNMLRTFNTEAIFTKAAYRNRGYAEKLIQKTIERLVLEGGRRMVLTVYEDNAVAKTLYEKMGYTEFERLTEMRLTF